MRRFSVVAFALFIGAAQGSLAQDARWGVSDAATRAALERELDAILTQPVDGAQAKGPARLAPAQRDLLDADPLLREAYRSDPRKTLDLIDRIRAASENAS